MVLILTSENGMGSCVAKGLEKLNIDPVCCDKRDDIGDVSQYRAVFFSGDFAVSSSDCAELAKALCEECASAEVPVIFDPNLSVLKSDCYGLINELAAKCEIFVPSDDDTEPLCGLTEPEEIAEHYLKLGTKKIVISLDKKGAYFKSAKESGVTPTFRADKVVDTTGAGIAFAAGLISGVIDDIPLAEAVVRANACGCIAIQKEGIYFPDASELREYMLDHRFAVEGCKDF